MASFRTERILLILLLGAYLVVGALFAIRTPAWQAPDEPAHYNYVVQVAENGCCPLLEMGDWDSAYLDVLKSERFAPGLLSELETVQYEDHQPPLYYLLASLVYHLTGGSLTALRLFSLLLGAGVALGAYAVGKALLPRSPQVALGAAAFVAFLPQHLATLASVSNDSLAELLVALTLWQAVRFLKTERVPVWQLGVLVGVGLLVKVSTLFLVGVAGLAILLKWWMQRRGEQMQRRALLRDLVQFALPVLLLGGVWWARNVSVYGFPDLFGLARHDVVVTDQARTAERIAEIGLGAYLRESAAITFNSFWGQFGWMAFPLQGWMYALILLFLCIAGLGVLVGWRRPLPQEPERAAQRAAWGLIGVTALAAGAQYVYYNLEFLQLQGRYLYPGLIPLGIALALGFDGWRRRLFGVERERSPLSAYAGVAIIALLLPFDLYLIWRVIPGLAP